MKRTSKKVISLLLALVCMLSCLSTGTAFARDGAITDHQAIVLVLDTSGSMYGKPITNLKKAALEFCNKIIGADPNNQIAIVTFADYSNTNDFSSNLTELARTISNISADGGTEMADAIQSADNLLKKDTLKNGYIKSIVVMADGEPFDPDETVQSATALFSKYNMYSIGFFEYANEEAKNLLKSIQNCGYYEANDVNALIDEFVKIATDILNPFTVKLSHENIDKIENAQNPGSYTYKYKVTAEIVNSNSKQANNVKVSIDLSQSIGIVLSSGSKQTINVGTLGANETKTLTWNIEMPMVVLGVTMYDVYSVTASSDNTVDITASDKIIIDYDDDYNKKNNELDFNKDIWSFSNYSVDKVPLTDEDYNAFMYGRPNTEKQEWDDIINAKQSGQCYGMAATTILSKMHIIGITDLQDKVNCLHDVKKNEKSKSLIGVYYLTQLTELISNNKKEFTTKTDAEKLTIIKSLAQNVNNGGNPFILSFAGTDDNGNDWGHAVVAYAYEAGNFTKNGREYSNRILIYDNNYSKWEKKTWENSCLYFNEEDSSWCIPNYEDATSLTRALSDLKIMDSTDIETNRENSTALLRANNQTRFLINSSKNQYSINGLRTTDVTVFCDDGGVNNSSTLNIFLPDVNDTYTVNNIDSKNELDLSMNYDNYYMVANSSKCDNAEFNPNGSVSLNGNTADFKVALTGNDGYISLPWYTIAVNGGNNTSNPSLTKSDNGYIFEGDNLENITVTGRNDEETKELTFTTTEDKVLIGENDEELTVSIDKDKDGVYETVIADSKNSKKSAELTNLETENFKLSPAFAPAVRDYNSSVNYSVSKVALIPTLENGVTATISVNNSAPVDFNSKQSVDLNVGKNTIKIVVSADNLESSTYTITVNRSQSSAMKSPNTGNNMNDLIIPIATAVILSGFATIAYIVNKRKKKFYE